MLSVHKMEDNELEEGEACFNKDDANIDPDKSFSYIEEKVHNLLGHLVKDFDGVVSSEKLAVLHGGYGSFLPMYQRSPPVHPQQKTPQRVQTFTTSHSPLHMNSKDATQHASISSNVSVPFRPGTATNLLLKPKVTSDDVSATRLPLQVAENLPLKHTSSESKLVNVSDQPSLKVRIKLGSGNKTSKNTAIYNGLGLTSPSSSENSPEQIGEKPIQSSGIPCESPGSILQSMTSSHVPGSLFLSPLHESMLCLVKKENLPLERKIVLSIKGRQKKSSMFKDDSASAPGYGDVLEGKKKKSGGGKSETSKVVKHENGVESKDNMTSHLKTSKAKEIIESTGRLHNDLKIKLLSNSMASNSLNNSFRSPETYREAGKDAPVKKRKLKNDWARDTLLTIDMSNADSDTSKGEKGSSGMSVGRLERKSDPNSTCDELDRRKVVNEMLSFEGKKKSKVSQNKDKSASNLMEERVRSDIQVSRKDKKGRNSNKDILGTGSECTSGQMKVLKRPTGDKSDECKVESVKQKEALNDGHFTGGFPSEMGPSQDVSEPVQEWVQCDDCQKWRSLPWEMKADQLPKQWLCSMLNWLPGMNRCDVSEDDTTNAVNLINFQNHADSTVSGITSAGFGQLYQNNQNFITDAIPNQGRKKLKSKLVDRSSNDMNQPLIETNLKGDNAVCPIMSCDFGMEKNAPKQYERHVNEGDMESKKVKKKRESDQYEHEIFKKTKNLASECDGDFKNEIGGPNDRLLISVKKQRDSTQVSLKSGFLDQKTCDPKKRKLRDWQESQGYLETLKTNENHLQEDKVYPKEEISDQIFKKQRKFKTEGTELSTSKADDKSYKNSVVTKIILSGTKDNSSRKCLPSERFPMATTSSSSNLNSHKRAGFQVIKGSPVESVSSSPMRVSYINKLSPSQRGISVKVNTKNGDSIVRTSRKSLDGETNVETNQISTERNRKASRNVPKYHNTDDRQNFDGKSESRVKHISRPGNSCLVSNVADTLIGQSVSLTDINVSNNCSIEGRLSKKNEPNGATFPKKSGKEISSRSKDKNKSCNLQRVKVKVSDPLCERELTKNKDIEHHGVDSRPEESNDAKHQFSNNSGTKSNKEGKCDGEKGYGILTSDCKREKPTELREDNGSEAKVDDICREERRVALRQNVIQGFDVEIPKERGLTKVESTGGKLEMNPCDAPVDRDKSKVLKRPGVHHSVVNVAPDCAVKEDISGQAAKNALKEAEAAKDLADRLKDSGFDFGCFGYNEAYFEAALKFLHCASLLEACSNDGRRVEMDQMQAYSMTAKLCETCAQEFEKRKEMAAAALAYKCMEVAYLKLVYCKNSSSNKDRHDLEASLQMIPLGESPSSSASDIDNLNNHAAIDKAGLFRGNIHAGNHVIVARNRPNFIRLLDFTNNVNYAMEASRKSQHAFATANMDETQNKEGIVSVKKVIEFSFQDIEEFIRLVRHASKAITSSDFSGNRG